MTRSGIEPRFLDHWQTLYSFSSWSRKIYWGKQIIQELKYITANLTGHWHNKYSPMARETWVQSQVESYQRLKKWYLILPCLTLSIIRLGSRVKWSNSGNRVAPSPTPWCSSYRKERLRVTLDYDNLQQIQISLNISHNLPVQDILLHM